jgi:hypothetical protein
MPIRTTARLRAAQNGIRTVVTEPDIVADRMGQISGQDVRLKHVDVHTDAHGLSGADRPHGGNSGPSVFKGLTPGCVQKSALQYIIHKTWTRSSIVDTCLQ